MKQRFIPLEKSSKRKQKEYHAAQRRTWGDINPVTRKPKNPKAYDRKKNRQRNARKTGNGMSLIACFLGRRIINALRRRKHQLSIRIIGPLPIP